MEADMTDERDRSAGAGVASEPPPALDDDSLLDDPELRAEIELMTELVLAAAQSDGPLTPGQIDRALGLG
jgi:hypothetical protein